MQDLVHHENHAHPSNHDHRVTCYHPAQIHHARTLHGHPPGGPGLSTPGASPEGPGAPSAGGDDPAGLSLRSRLVVSRNLFEEINQGRVPNGMVRRERIDRKIERVVPHISHHVVAVIVGELPIICLLYTSPSPRD